MSKKITYIASVLTAFSAAVLLAGASPASAGFLFGTPAEAEVKHPDPLPRVEVAPVKRLKRAEQGITTTSTLEASKEVVVKSKVTGKVDQVCVSSGDRVRAGEKLAVLDSRSKRAECASAEAQVAICKAELAQAQSSLNDAKREYDRYSRLRKSGYATQQEFDMRSTTYAAAKAARDRAGARVAQSKANLEAQKVNLSDYTLRAPIDGVVLDDYDLTEGTLLSGATDAFRIGCVDVISAKVNVPERDMWRLRPGMEAELTFESLGGKSYYGRVTSINPYINTSTRTLSAEISIDNRSIGDKLCPGMFARVLLIETSDKNPLTVPTTALRADGTIAVVTRGRIDIRKVETGAVTDGRVAILSGVSAGEAVVTFGGKNVANGAEVESVLSEEKI